MLKIIFIIVASLPFVFVSGNTFADRVVREKIGPHTYKTYRVKDPESKPGIKWREQTRTTTSGSEVRVRKEILHETVCYNYEPGSIIYRRCRQNAKELFEQKCAFFDKKYRETQRPYDKQYQADRDMFCRSSSSFCP